jgi:hypothetical protein
MRQQIQQNPRKEFQSGDDNGMLVCVVKLDFSLVLQKLFPLVPEVVPWMS